MWARGEERVPATTLLAPPGSLSWEGAGLRWSQVRSAGTLESMIRHQVLTGTDTWCHLCSRGRTPKTSRGKWLQPLPHSLGVTLLCGAGLAQGRALGNQHSPWPNVRPLGTPPPRPSRERDKLQEGASLLRQRLLWGPQVRLAKMFQ